MSFLGSLFSGPKLPQVPALSAPPQIIVNAPAVNAPSAMTSATIPGTSADEANRLEQARIKRARAGRSGTILTNGLSGDNSNVSTKTLGAA